MGIAKPLFAQSTDSATKSLSRPAIMFNRWQENWSALCDSVQRTDLFDALKCIPFSQSDPNKYVSLGVNLRERFEAVNNPAFGLTNQISDSYLLHRFQFHADIHPNQNWQIFLQLEDVRTVDKTQISSVDKDQFDIEQAFAVYVGKIGDGELKVRVGRQEIGFDLQRFVSVRDGPNVRQAFDAVWFDYELSLLRFITFWSHPVQYRHNRSFDDFSNSRFQYGGFRVERKLDIGELSAYYSRWQLDNAQRLFASGNERLDNFDIRYAGMANGFDWDLEVMGQIGQVGVKDVKAWAIGTLMGYTFSGTNWLPRIGLQLDAASGNRNASANEIQTFNPLFPNGYYFTLAGFTGYSNLVHIKPSLKFHPTQSLQLLAATGLQWRETTADAVYVQPNVAVPNTAGHGGSWTGVYWQLRADYVFSPNFTGAVEAVHFDVGDVIRRAGGQDADYIGVELKFGW